MHISEKIAYFNELEPIAKLFNSPGESLCLIDSFIPYLERLDICIQFMETNVISNYIIYFYLRTYCRFHTETLNYI
jgi:hypothetical protein